MKSLITLLIVLSIGTIHAQVKKAPMNVFVTDMAGVPIPNDKITFIAQRSRQEIVGITDAKGHFKVSIPGGDVYAIKVAVIGDQIDYTTFEVPTPPPGVNFRTQTMEIRYKVPTSVVLEDLHFASGKHTIEEESFPILDQLVEHLLRKKAKIRIEGHTDSDGSKSSNKILSENRAIAVKSYLIGKGVPADLIEAKGLGEEMPIEDNSTQEGKAKNRRTEIHLVED
jgi:outer membrane protein OmpA-like peptidoglycan-associated protein